MRTTPIASIIPIGLALLAAACGNSTSGNTTSASVGGAATNGGTPAAGGATVSGGATASGGTMRPTGGTAALAARELVAQQWQSAALPESAVQQ